MRRFMWFDPLIAIAALTVPSRSTSAQPARPPSAGVLAVGARVRLTPANRSPQFPDGARRIGVLRGAARDSLVVLWADGGEETLPVAEVRRLDVSRGRQRAVWQGLAIGLAAGAGTGAIIGAASYTDDGCGEFGCLVDFGRNFHAGIGAAIGGAAGVLVGGTIGAVGRWERWRRLPTSALAAWVDVEARPARGGAAVGITVGRRRR